MRETGVGEWVRSRRVSPVIPNGGRNLTPVICSLRTRRISPCGQIPRCARNDSTHLPAPDPRTNSPHHQRTNSHTHTYETELLT